MITDQIKKEMKQEALDKYKAISKCDGLEKLEDGFREYPEIDRIAFYFNIEGGSTKTITREV